MDRQRQQGQRDQQRRADDQLLAATPRDRGFHHSARLAAAKASWPATVPAIGGGRLPLLMAGTRPAMTEWRLRVIDVSITACRTARAGGTSAPRGRSRTSPPASATARPAARSAPPPRRSAGLRPARPTG